MLLALWEFCEMARNSELKHSETKRGKIREKQGNSMSENQE